MSNNAKPEKERSWSKSLEYTKNSTPVVANTSFMIGGQEISMVDNQKRKFLNNADHGQKDSKHNDDYSAIGIMSSNNEYEHHKHYTQKEGDMNNFSKGILKSKEVEEWLDNQESFSNENSKLGDSMDDKEMFSRITSSFGPNTIHQNSEASEQGEKRENNTNYNDWMYQTVGSFNETPTVSVGHVESFNYNMSSQLHVRDKVNEEIIYNRESKPPVTNYISKMFTNKICNLHSKIENSHLDEFMQQQEKVFREDTFSIENDKSCDYDNLETYMKNY